MNPYSAPQSDLEDAGVEDCWREGKVFVMKRDSLFPRRCVKCNGDAQRPVRSRRIFWLHPGWYAVFPVNLLMYFFLAPIFPLIGAFVLPNILLYVIFIAIVRKKASIEPGLCAKHARTRNLFLGLGSFMFVVSGMAVLSVALGRSTTDLTGYGALGMIVAMVITSFGSRIVKPVHISSEQIRLKGCSEQFLAGLAPRRPHE